MTSPQGGQVYSIGGIDVHFPYKAYGTQLSMISRMIQGLDKKENCLLESPTGSGKSLALLCAALAWQSSQYEKAAQEEMNGTSSADCCCACHRPQTDGASTSADSGLGSAKPDLAMNPVHASGVEATSTVIEAASKDAEKDSDDDFKPANKSFKTSAPNKKKRAHLGIRYEDDADTSVASVDGGESPTTRWQMLLTNAHVSNCANQVETKKKANCTSCDCTEKAAIKKDQNKSRVPKIYFGTRTHKQIAQIIRELKKTAYKNKRMSILASREHTCIHRHISQLPNKNEECRNAREVGGCSHFEHARKLPTHESLKDVDLDPAFDIEEFVSACSKKKACPYYVTNQIREGADIVFCPYNYLIDPIVRSQMEICLKECVIILDEAHNIEDSAREAASFKFTMTQLDEAKTDLENMINRGQKPREHQQLADIIAKIVSFIDINSTTLERQSFEQSAQHWSGQDMLARLNYMGLGPAEFPAFGRLCQEIWADESDPRDRYRRDFKLKASTSQLLEHFLFALGFVYKSNMCYLDDYRLALVRSTTYRAAPTNNQWLGRNRRKMQPSVEFTLNFWCMNPAVGFRDASDKVHSVILTSGTLSPMDSFQSELGVPFSIQLEANHVIGKKQVFVGTVGSGPTGQLLNASYQHAETFSFQDELGKLVLKTCQVVPHGVLCFFPSYRMLDKVSSRWQETGLWGKICEKKTIVSESRSSADFDETMHEFYEVINETDGIENVEDQQRTGALFLAVCRGKVSEGLDFTDNNARAVITVGIPFPNVKDLQVSLKRKYNDQHNVQRGLLSGGQWYETQAYRALNQALGRCIRHQYDWGALILVDDRFNKNPKHVKGLSKWVRQKTVPFHSFSMAHSQLQDFVMDRLSDPAPNNTSLNITLGPSTLDKTAGEESVLEPSTPLMKVRTVGDKENKTPAVPETLRPDLPAVATSSTTLSETQHAASMNVVNGIDTPQAKVHSAAILARTPQVLASTPVGKQTHALAYPLMSPVNETLAQPTKLTNLFGNSPGANQTSQGTVMLVSQPSTLTAATPTRYFLVPDATNGVVGGQQVPLLVSCQQSPCPVPRVPGSTVEQRQLMTPSATAVMATNVNHGAASADLNNLGAVSIVNEVTGNEDVKKLDFVDLTNDNEEMIPCTPPLFDSEEVMQTTDSAGGIRDENETNDGVADHCNKNINVKNCANLDGSESIVGLKQEMKTKKKSSEVESKHECTLSGAGKTLGHFPLKKDILAKPVADLTNKDRLSSAKSKLQQYSFRDANTVKGDKLEKSVPNLKTNKRSTSAASDTVQVKSEKKDLNACTVEPSIRTRRSGRKRQSIGDVGQRKKSKADDFLTDIDAENSFPRQLKCKNCQSVLGEIARESDVQFMKCFPDFMKNAFVKEPPKGGFLVIDKSVIDNNMAALQAETKSGMCMNSLYSHTDHCSVVYLACCIGCSRHEQAQAVQVVAVDNKCKTHKNGEVWWIPS